jgi:uncharacterized protein
VDAFWKDSTCGTGVNVDVSQWKPKEAAITLLANHIASHTATTDAVLEYVQRYARVQTSKASASSSSSAKKSNDNAESKTRDFDKKYSTYYDFTSSFSYIKEHQVLAIRRGVQQKALKLTFDIDGERVESRIRRSLLDEQILLTGQQQSRALSLLWKDAMHDAWTRLLRKRSTNRLWKDTCIRAEEQSIHVFCDNLQKALLAPPVQPLRPVLALDPGFQAGIKCALLNEQGALMDSMGSSSSNTNKALTTVHFLNNQRSKGLETLVNMLERISEYQQSTHKNTQQQEQAVTVALGNGHGSHEARELVREASKAASIPIDIGNYIEYYGIVKKR